MKFSFKGYNSYIISVYLQDMIFPKKKENIIYICSTWKDFSFFFLFFSSFLYKEIEIELKKKLYIKNPENIEIYKTFSLFRKFIFILFYFSFPRQKKNFQRNELFSLNRWFFCLKPSHKGIFWDVCLFKIDLISKTQKI